MIVMEDINKHPTSQNQIFNKDTEDLNDINKNVGLIDQWIDCGLALIWRRGEMRGARNRLGEEWTLGIPLPTPSPAEVSNRGRGVAQTPPPGVEPLRGGCLLSGSLGKTMRSKETEKRERQKVKMVLLENYVKFQITCNSYVKSSFRIQ